MIEEIVREQVVEIVSIVTDPPKLYLADNVLADPM